MGIERNPSAVFHVFAAMAFALVAYEYRRNAYVAIAGGTLFGLLP